MCSALSRLQVSVATAVVFMLLLCSCLMQFSARSWSSFLFSNLNAPWTLARMAKRGEGAGYRGDGEGKRVYLRMKERLKVCEWSLFFYMFKFGVVTAGSYQKKAIKHFDKNCCPFIAQRRNYVLCAYVSELFLTLLYFQCKHTFCFHWVCIQNRNLCWFQAIPLISSFRTTAYWQHSCVGTNRDHFVTSK